MTGTNKHLKSIIGEMKNFMENGSEPPEDLAFEFVMELRVSSLILPGIVEGSQISFPNFQGDEGEEILPLFTDEEEFLKFGDEYIPVESDFSYYVSMVGDLNFDGIIINCQSDEFFVDSELIRQIPPLNFNTGNAQNSPEDLRKIAENVSNESLLSFIGDDSNFNNYDDLKELLYDSLLLNAVSVEDSFNGADTVKRSEEGFSIACTKTSADVYQTLFTSLDAIKQTSTEEVYFQIANLLEIFKFVLTGDLDGIVINPGLEEYYIPRNQIIRWIDDEKLITFRYADAIDYAFKI